MTVNPTKLKDWIQYLKNSRIVSLAPDNGKLKYLRKVTANDMGMFLQSHTSLSDEDITSLIQSFRSNEPLPADQEPQARPEDDGWQNHYDKATGSGKYAKKPEEDLPDWMKTADPVKEPKPHYRLKSKPGEKPEYERLREANENFTLSEKDVENILGKVDSLNAWNDSTPAEKKPEQMTPHPIPKGYGPKPVNPNLPASAHTQPQQPPGIPAQQAPQAKNPQQAAPAAQNNPAAQPQQAPAASAPTDRKRVEDLNKFKKAIRDKMSPQQRKSFYRLLTDDNDSDELNEEQVTRADAKALLKGAAEQRDKGGILGFTKSKISLGDLQKAWASADYPDDTRDIAAMLKKQFGFSDREIKKVFANVFGKDDEQDDGADYHVPAASPQMQNLADYAHKAGIAEPLAAFMKAEYGEELGLEKPGFFKKHFGKKKATFEEVRQIFTEMLAEEREDRFMLIRQQEEIQLGRAKK